MYCATNNRFHGQRFELQLINETEIKFVLIQLCECQNSNLKFASISYKHVNTLSEMGETGKLQFEGIRGFKKAKIFSDQIKIP